MSLDKPMSIKEFAKYFKISHHSAWRLVNKKKIKSCKLFGKHLIHQKEVLRLMNINKTDFPFLSDEDQGR